LRSWKLTCKGRLSATSRRGHRPGMRQTCPPAACGKGSRTRQLRYLRLIVWCTANLGELLRALGLPMEERPAWDAVPAGGERAARP
jgi:hypothetical protein